jgi:hypothetical protein
MKPALGFSILKLSNNFKVGPRVPVMISLLKVGFNIGMM